MDIAIVSGSNGLIGSESVSFLCEKMDMVIGIDNDQRAYFFGPGASTRWQEDLLVNKNSNFKPHNTDIRDNVSIQKIFEEYGTDIKLIIHAAAQPSHDWAAKEPITDFTINANGTLIFLELTRLFCLDAVFLFTSTNKVYGDTPNSIPLVEFPRRYDVMHNPLYSKGIDETMSIDQSKHSVFGASKVAADVMVQEYGRYFGMKTAVFRGGCLTGPHHSGTQLHGFLSYLMKCAVTGEHYTIFGYKGKQVRDNIHSWDVVNMFWHFYRKPKPGGQVYNIGGGRFSNCSVLEAIDRCERITGNKMNTSYVDEPRSGDHKWYISDVSKFKADYPDWDYQYSLEDIMQQLFESQKKLLQ